MEVGLFEDMHLIFDLPSGSFGVIDLKQLEFCTVDKIEEIKNYQRFKLDPRLLKRALTGLTSLIGIISKLVHISTLIGSQMFFDLTSIY